jgi:hypothetical protein
VVVTTELDPRYVAARRILLDALVALNEHADAIVVAGAQAVYLRTGETDLAVAPYTTDSDLAIDPSELRPDPLLDAAMKQAGFALDISRGHIEPGIWVRSIEIDGVEAVVPVDLIVPTAAASPGGRRGARLGEHGNQAARKITGLEAALYDHDTMTIAALGPGDDRVVVAKVAGTAALLVAKAYKLQERVDRGREDRLDDKDALDCVRLMQASNPEHVGATLRTLQAEPVAAEVTATAIGYLERLFGRRGRPGIRMAADALRFVMPEERVTAICAQYNAAMVAAATNAT